LRLDKGTAATRFIKESFVSLAKYRQVGQFYEE
jgi:hypothetical protein